LADEAAGIDVLCSFFPSTMAPSASVRWRRAPFEAMLMPTFSFASSKSRIR